jgi:hypothetical protein
MAQPAEPAPIADPVGKKGGYFNLANPSISVGPALPAQPEQLPPSPAFKETGAPFDTGDTAPPGT